MMKTPVLVITFNRPKNTVRVLSALKSIRPQCLYVFQDGPREEMPEDVQKCAEVRKVIELSIDWPCKVLTSYQEKNLGCGRGPYTAISWLFQNEDQGIILEDDIFPHPLFFPYMENLLDRYKDNQRIGMVSGHNLQRQYSFNNSYYFTYETMGTWGWGTWRRVWNGFDFEIPYHYEKLNNALKKYRIPKLCRQRYCKLYKQWLSGSRQDYWDYQFDYYLIINHYLNIRPNSCLTSNEGDGLDATHTFVINEKYGMSVNVPLFENLRHPSRIIVDQNVRWRLLKKEIHLLLKKYL